MGKKKNSSPSSNGAKKLSPNKLNELNVSADHLLKICFESPSLNPAAIWTQYSEMQESLHNIQLIEAELKPKAANRSRAESIEAFYDWLRGNGVQFDGVKIAQYPNYEFGLEATRNYPANETFVVIPKRVIFSLDNLGDEARKLLDKLPVLDSMPNVKLAVALLVERLLGAKSLWKPYIDLLPVKYATVMYFTQQEMHELRGSSAFVPALNQCKNIARQYAFLRKAIFSFKDPADDVVHLMQERFTFDLYW